MQGLLLGLGDIIGNAFKAVLMAVVKPILELVIKWVIEPLLTLVIKVISYTIGAVLYVIGSFLLQLVDFVEVLFRALAGMESVSASGMTMSLSLDGGSGDILIQLIRHPDIQSAFVSMCVVGLFLLVVTTVFQIIKVEYTTEGAKNAKGPIFQKAFKGFANLMLLPLLVIFGIIFANQLLGLLDTATKGTGDNPTISGLIFVSSAGEAHYLANEEVMDIEGDSWLGICIEGIGYGIIELLNGLFGGAWEDEEYVNTKMFEGQIDEIENNFISQKEGYRYYNISEVSQYYNYAYINYLLLLFGAVFALKALFFSCFGMVIRLYKCAVLFIISPAIIGMTPINEGGLGKWRTAFIGQVLSAYGTILSLNLFFIIVRVLLSVEVNFQSSASNVMGNMLTGGFMTLLLKCIFVLAGCLLIEKFSKEIGAYFGAEDAMSAGKDMAGQVGDLAMKGVGAAAMVASGGAGLAMKAGKMAGGIAGKIGKSGIGQAIGNSKFGKGVGSVVGGIKALPGKGVGLVKNAGKALGRTAPLNALGNAGAWLKGGKGAVAARKGRQMKDNVSEWNATKKQIAEAEKNLNPNTEGYMKRQQQLNLLKQKAARQKTQLDKSSEGLKSYKSKSGVTDDEIKAANKDYSAEQDAKKERRAERGRKALSAISTVYGLGMQGRKNLPGMKYFDQFGKAAGEGAKALGDPFEAAQGSVEYMKGKRRQDLWQGSGVIKGLIDAQNAYGAEVLMKQVVKEAEFSKANIQRTSDAALENLIAALNGRNRNSDESRMMINSYLGQINSTGANLTFGELTAKLDEVFRTKGDGKTVDLGAIRGQVGFNMETELKVNFDPKAIGDAVEKAMKKGALTPEAIRKELQGVFADLGAKGEANLLKIIQDAIAKVGSQIGGK